MDLSEIKTITQAKQGDKLALLALYNQYLPLFKKLCRKKLPTGIRKKNTNSFEIRVKHDGKTYYEYAPTLTEAKKKRVDLKYRLAHGTYIKPTSYTFDEWFNFWIENYKMNSVKIGTIQTYRNYYNSCVKERFGNVKLDKIKGADMLSADSSFCVAYVEPPFRSFELSERRFGPIECGILESTEPPLNLVESSQRSSLSERVRPFAKTLGLFQLTGAARPLSFFMVSH